MMSFPISYLIRHMELDQEISIKSAARHIDPLIFPAISAHVKPGSIDFLPLPCSATQLLKGLRCRFKSMIMLPSKRNLSAKSPRMLTPVLKRQRFRRF
jgi:hypothetical protein